MAIARLVGAYGREADHKQWLEGRDFRIVDQDGYFGPYLSIRDCNVLLRDGYTHVELIHSRTGALIHPTMDLKELVEYSRTHNVMC